MVRILTATNRSSATLLRNLGKFSVLILCSSHDSKSFCNFTYSGWAKMELKAIESHVSSLEMLSALFSLNDRKKIFENKFYCTEEWKIGKKIFCSQFSASNAVDSPRSATVPTFTTLFHPNPTIHCSDSELAVKGVPAEARWHEITQNSLSDSTIGKTENVFHHQEATKRSDNKFSKQSTAICDCNGSW